MYFYFFSLKIFVWIQKNTSNFPLVIAKIVIYYFLISGIVGIGITIYYGTTLMFVCFSRELFGSYLAIIFAVAIIILACSNMLNDLTNVMKKRK